MTLDNLKKAKIKISDFRKGQETNYLLESAEKQLDYLITALANDVIDPTKLRNITLGVIAVREVEGIDDSLAEMLYEIDLWAKRKGNLGN